MKNIILIIFLVFTNFSIAQFSFPKSVIIDPSNLMFKSLGVKKVIQYELNYSIKDSINYYSDSSQYFQPDYIFEYDSIGNLKYFKSNFSLKPPAITLEPGADSIRVKKSLDHFDMDNKRVLIDYYTSNNQIVYSKEFIYTQVSNNGFKYSLLSKVIERLDGYLFRETIIQYQF